MRVNFVSIAISIIAVTVIAISYHTQTKNFFIDQASEQVESQLKIQTDQALSKLKYELSRLQKDFIELGQVEGYERMSQPKDGTGAVSAQLQDSRFLGLALLTPDPTWSPLWVSLNPQIQTQWSKVFLTQLWGQLPYARLEEGKSFWYKVPFKDSNFYWALIQKVKIPTTELPVKGETSESKPAILVGFLAHDSVADLATSIVGDDTDVFVVDNYSQTLYHSDLNYLGESLPEYSGFESLSQAESTEYTNVNNEKMLGMRRPLASSNLYVIYGVKAPEKIALTQKLFLIHALVWLIVVLGLVGFFLFYQKDQDKKIINIKKLLKTWNTDKNIRIENDEFERLGELQPQIKELKSWIEQKNHILEDENLKLKDDLTKHKESSHLQDQSLLQSLKRPLMLSLGSLQVIKQKNKMLAQTEEFLQIEQTIRSLKERIDMSVSTQGDSTQAEFFLAEVIHECIKTQQDLTSRLGVYINVNLSEKLSIIDNSSRWIAVLSQVLLELYDWIELSTDKTIEMNFNITDDQPVISFQLSNCGLNPFDIQSINEGSFSELNNPTWKLIGQSLSRMQLGFKVESNDNNAKINIYIPAEKIGNFALVESSRKAVEKIQIEEDAAFTEKQIASYEKQKSTDFYEISEDDIDLDSFKVIPTQTSKATTTSSSAEHDSFVSGTEIGQAPLFSDEELQDIQRQIEEAKKNKS